MAYPTPSDLNNGTYAYLITFPRPSCVCRTRSSISAKSFLPALSPLLFPPSTPSRKLARAHIRPAWHRRAFLPPSWCGHRRGSGRSGRRLCSFGSAFCNKVFFGDLGRLVCGFVGSPLLLAILHRFLLRKRRRSRKCQASKNESKATDEYWSFFHVKRSELTKRTFELGRIRKSSWTEVQPTLNLRRSYIWAILVIGPRSNGE